MILIAMALTLISFISVYYSEIKVPQVESIINEPS